MEISFGVAENVGSVRFSLYARASIAIASLSAVSKLLRITGTENLIIR